MTLTWAVAAVDAERAHGPAADDAARGAPARVRGIYARAVYSRRSTS